MITGIVVTRGDLPRSSLKFSPARSISLEVESRCIGEAAKTEADQPGATPS